MQVVVLALSALLGASFTYALRPLVRTEMTKADAAATPPAIGVLEAVSAASVAALAYRFGMSPGLLGFGALAVLGVVLAALDQATRRLPNRLIGAAYVIVLVPLIADAAVHGDLRQLGSIGLSVVVALLVHAILYGLGGLAGGDLKLVGVLAGALGWISWQAVVSGLGLGWVLAAVYVMARLITPKWRRSDIALGPFLIVGTLVTAVVAGPAL